MVARIAPRCSADSLVVATKNVEHVTVLIAVLYQARDFNKLFGHRISKTLPIRVAGDRPLVRPLTNPSIKRSCIEYYV